jgi:hypothetical protein
MPEKRFQDIQGDDPRLRERYLADHQQQPPDNFIESAEGGGIDSAEVERQTGTEEFDSIQKLEDRIRRLRPDEFKEGEDFRY